MFSSYAPNDAISGVTVNDAGHIYKVLQTCCLQDRCKLLPERWHGTQQRLEMHNMLTCTLCDTSSYNYWVSFGFVIHCDFNIMRASNYNTCHRLLLGWLHFWRYLWNRNNMPPRVNCGGSCLLRTMHTSLSATIDSAMLCLTSLSRSTARLAELTLFFGFENGAHNATWQKGFWSPASALVAVTMSTMLSILSWDFPVVPRKGEEAGSSPSLWSRYLSPLLRSTDADPYANQGSRAAMPDWIWQSLLKGQQAEEDHWCWCVSDKMWCTSSADFVTMPRRPWHTPAFGRIWGSALDSTDSLSAMFSYLHEISSTSCCTNLDFPANMSDYVTHKDLQSV